MKRKILLILACLFVPLLMVGCKKEQPALSSPQNLRVDDGFIVFDSVKGAQYYTIIIDELVFDVYTDNDKVQVIDNIVKYNASNILSMADTYSIKVKACSKTRKDSSFTEDYKYKYVKEIEDATNFKINGTTLTWDAVDFATHYIIKVVTPQNKVLLDSKGNKLNKEDEGSIEKAVLSEFKVKTNSFNFDSLISQIGNYEFYVKAENINTEDYVASGFVEGENYEHYKQLKTPVNLSVDKDGTSLILSTVLDENANSVKIKIGKFVAEIDISSNNVEVKENISKINLTKAFESVFVAGEKLDFSKISVLEIETSAEYKTEDISYYKTSAISKKFIYNNTNKMPAPNGLTLAYNTSNNTFVASWNLVTENANNVRGYKLIVATSSGVETYSVGATISTCQIGNDVIAVAVKTLGTANYVSSEYSTYVANLDNTYTITGFNVVCEGNTVSWSAVADYYIIEFADNHFVSEDFSYRIPKEYITEKTNVVKVSAIKNGYRVATKQADLTLTEKLAKPSIELEKDKNGTCRLTISKVENAIGYNVYVAAANKNTYTKIEKLFTETTIELNEFLSTDGNYSNYKIKVKAVANEYSKYTNSDYSAVATLLSSNQLQTPEFYKEGEIDAPIVKLGKKYYLRFNGVENATGYDVLVNYNLKTYGLVEGVYYIDITNYLQTAGEYNIMVRAIAPQGSQYISSEYNTLTFNLAEQLQEVKNIQVNKNGDVYTLAFDLVENATSYRVRIDKVGDDNYNNYLEEKDLSNQFVIDGLADISKYLEQSGTYNIYVTAINSVNKNYSESIESTTYATITK